MAMDIVSAFECKHVEGVEVIVWKINTSETPSASKKRQRLRDNVGKNNIHVPMLDMKLNKRRLNYCDFVVNVDDISAWHNAIINYYTQLHGSGAVKQRDINNGKKLVVVVDEEETICYNLYSSTKRIVMQPGEGKGEQSRVLAALRIFPDILALTNSSSKGSTPSSEPAAEQLTVKLPPIAPEKSSKGSTPSSEPAAEQLTVKLPPIAPEKSSVNAPVIKAQDPEDPASKDLNTEKSYVNEFLCFLQNKSRSLPVDSLTKLCIDFYSPDTIRRGKCLLFEHTASVRNSNQRLVKRQTDSSLREDIRDIYTLLLTLDPNDIPVYLAKDLRNLPPLSAFDNDVIALHQDIEAIKGTLGIIEECKAGIDTIAKELKSVKSSRGNLSPQKEHNRKKGGTPPAPTPKRKSTTEPGTIRSLPSVPTPANDKKTPAPIVRKKNSREVPRVSESSEGSLYDTVDVASDSDSESCSSTDSDDSTYAAVARRQLGNSSAPQSTPGHVVQRTPARPSAVTPAREVGKGLPVPNHKKSRRSRSKTPGAGKVTWERKNRPAAATGSHGILRAAKSPYERNSYGNRSITGVFVSRMDSKTSCANVAVHVRRQLCMVVRPEKIWSKCGHYASFYIRCERNQRQDLLDRNLWPRGATVKPYFE